MTFKISNKYNIIMNNLNYIYKVSDKVILPYELNGAHVVGYGVGEFNLVDEDIQKNESF